MWLMLELNCLQWYMCFKQIDIVKSLPFGKINLKNEKIRQGNQQNHVKEKKMNTKVLKIKNIGSKEKDLKAE